VFGPDSNGASEHTPDEASAPAVPEVGFDRFEDATVEATTETDEAIEEPARVEWGAGVASQQPAYTPLQPPASGPLSGLDPNGAREHTVGDAFAPAAREVDFYRGAAGDAAADVTAEAFEAFEVRAPVDWETGDPSQQPAHEPLLPPASGSLSGPDSNGASEHAVDEMSAAAAGEVESDRSAEEATAGAEPPRSDQGFAESFEESLESTAPLGEHARPGVRFDGSRSVLAHGAARSVGSQRVTLACLAAIFGLLVLMASRSLRGRC
jgi:hypothetical protein